MLVASLVEISSTVGPIYRKNTGQYMYVTHVKASKTIPVTGCGGLKCEMLRIPHCLDNRLIDSGKVFSPTHTSIGRIRSI
jgi:hypothetical protein